MPDESDNICEDSSPLDEKEIFLRALEIEDLSARASWLLTACGTDHDLRADVESLLAAAQDDSTLEPDRDLLVHGLQEMAESDDHFPSPGTAITYFGDYELLDEIARGAMGVVFRARQTSLNRIVAVKMIRGTMLSSESDVRRFKVEAEAAASLDHPNIVPIYEVGEHQDQHYFSMKLIAGGTLAGHLVKFGNDPRAAARLMVTIARAIQEAHQHGILHRDLKPANILLDDKDEPHITDFGLAKQLGTESGLTYSGQIMGTPFYMAPEQAAGNAGKLSTAADVYSLGAILFELLAGRPPFHGDSLLETLRMAREDPVPRLSSISSTGNSIDHDLETIVTKCLQKDPAARYAAADDLADDLEHWLAGRPITARPITPLERSFKWVKRKPVVASLVAVAALLLLTLGIGGPISAYRQNQLRLLSQTNAELAQASAEETDRARKRLELENYRFSIQLAESRLGTDEAFTVPQLLWETKPELRSWEWGHLMAQCQIEEWAVIAGAEPVVKIDASPDGSRFATLTKHTVTVWDSASATIVWQESYDEQLYDVALHPSGDCVAVVRATPDVPPPSLSPVLAKMRSEIVIHSGDSFSDTYVFEPNYRPLIAFGVDGGSFYVLSIDESSEKVTDSGQPTQGHLHRFASYDWAAAKASVELRYSAKPSRFLRVDPGGKWLGIASSWDQYEIYSAATLDRVTLINPYPNLGGADIALDSDRGRVISTSHRFVVETKLIGGDPTTGKKEFEVKHDTGQLSRLALLPGDRSYLALSEEGVTVVQGGKVERMIRQAPGCRSLAALPGNRCLVGDSRGVVRCWRWDAAVRPKPVFRCLNGAQGQHVEFHPDARRVLFRDHRRNELFQAEPFPTGDEVQEPLSSTSNATLGHVTKGPNARIFDRLPKFAPSGKLVCRGETGLLFSDPGGGPAEELPTPFSPLDAAFDKHGNWLVVSGENGSLAAIHQASGKVVTAEFTAGGTCRVDISKDGTLAVACQLNGHIYAWTPQTGALVFERVINGSSAAVHPAGVRIAVGSSDGIQLLDPRDGKTLRTIGSGQSCGNIRFSPDGLRIGTSTRGFTLWDWQLGEPLFNFKTTSGSRDLAFSPDGLSLGYTSMNPTLEVRFALPWQYNLGDPEFYHAVEKLFGTE